MPPPTGCPKKNAPLWFCLIFLVRKILEGWYIFHFKGGIDRSIWNTKTFLYGIREPRHNQNNMEYHISKFLNIEQSSVLKTDTQYCFPYISVLPCSSTSHLDSHTTTDVKPDMLSGGQKPKWNST